MAVVLLLTATVDPGTVANTARPDPRRRLEEYRAAVDAWLDHGPCDHLVLCESSGWPEADFADQREHALRRGRRFDYRTFRQDFPGHLGKGYGELGIIGHALDQVPALAEATMVLKATGRYRIANPRPLVDQAGSDGADVICDLREHLTVADCRWFAATPGFLRRHLLPRRGHCDDSQGRFLEHVLAEAVHAALAEGGSWRPPRIAPLISGVGGTTGRGIRTSWSKRLRHRLKAALLRH